MGPASRLKLLIAIPAYNEEASIRSVIERCLDARQAITARSPVTDVEIAVVSDGSTDRTVELARRYARQVKLIVFEKNRGYGAAIKEAWSGSDADLLGFLDADGTCDPEFFADLCRTLVEQEADLALGSRLNGQSKMPLVRRTGNLFFALLLSVFSHTRVRDTASGMRVLRRDALPRLLPLPDGLHFTPAMSSRALLGGLLKVVEIDMPYHEREGESKLRVWKDGLRFLRTIAESLFLYRPYRPLAALGAASFFLAAALMAVPTLHYLQHRSLEEWMIYRFIVSHLLGTNAVLMFCAAHVTGRMVDILFRDRSARSLFSSRWFWLLPVSAIVAGALLVAPSAVELMLSGATYEHWSRFIAMSFLVSTGFILLATRAVDYVLDLVAAQLGWLRAAASVSEQTLVGTAGGQKQ